MGEDCLSCMVRDPHWIYCHWELAGDPLERASEGRGPSFLEGVRLALRVSPVLGGDTLPQDVVVDPKASNWYLRVGPDRRVQVELGLLTLSGEFVALASGGEIETPPEPMGVIASRHWGPLSPELKRLVAQGLVGSSATSFGSKPEADR